MDAPRKPRRRKPSGIPSVVSIALVLFSLGLLGISIFAAREVSRYLKEEFLVEVYFADSADDEAAEKLTAAIAREPWALSADFVHKEKAAEKMKADFGEDFLQYYGSNFFPHKADLHIKAEFTGTESVAKIAAGLRTMPLVEDVRYQPDMLDQITANLRIAQWIILSVSLILVLVAISLIGSSLRLNVFASRFIIKSMQLVGATEGFIIYPFVKKFLGYAFWGWLLSLLLLGGTLTMGWYLLAPWGHLNELYIIPLIVLAVVLLFTGLILAAMSAWFGARKYLRMKIEQLY